MSGPRNRLRPIPHHQSVESIHDEQPSKKQRAVELNPLKVFPCETDTFTTAFFGTSLDRHVKKLNRLKAGKKWLHPLKADAQFGIEVIIQGCRLH